MEFDNVGMCVTVTNYSHRTVPLARYKLESSSAKDAVRETNHRMHTCTWLPFVFPGCHSCCVRVLFFLLLGLPCSSPSSLVFFLFLHRSTPLRRTCP